MSTAESFTPEPGLLEVLQAEAVLEQASGNKPMLLDDPESVWYVESGRVEIFTVSVRGGVPVGARSHFITVDVGQFMFGMNLAEYGMGSGFLAVGRLGTSLRRLKVSRLHQLAADPTLGEEIARLVDLWVTNLSRSLTREIIPGPIVDVNLTEGEEVTLTNQQKARSAKSVMWLDVRKGDLLFIDLEPITVDSRRALFPITPDTWIEVSSDSAGTVMKARPSDVVVADATFWSGLDLFHAALCQCEFINKKLATVDEFNRLKSKAEYSSQAEQEAYQKLARVLTQTAEQQETYAAADDVDAVFEACRAVGEYAGIQMKRHPAPRQQANNEERIAEIAKMSRFRTRPVVLRDDWYRRDQGPLIGTIEATKETVAIIPTSPTSYVLINPKNSSREKINEDVAATLAPFALTIYRPFPDGKLGVKELAKFGARGLKKDLLMLITLGLSMGVIGTLTPYATGQIFDQAIPQADRSLLLQFCVALFVAAATSTAFKIAQSIAVLRVQGRMDYSIQAALWDRLLNLPATFFSRYAAGDLADRASGVNKIREIIAGSGVAAILGMLSSIFYLGMLFKYSLPMAALAVGLTIVFVSFTSTMNILQLGYQRKMMGMGGKIGGLVLQLITGVAKLRTSGAENHAFRVWSEEFSSFRRIAFKAERIQNILATFNTGFPVFSSMAIFFVLVSVQSKAQAGGLVGGMSTGDFIAFSAAYGLFLTAIQALSDASLGMLNIVPTYERLKPILIEPMETDETKAYPGRLTGEIEISHVSFRYTEDGPWILKDISLKIRPGEFVAFVGGSGSGKSTLFRLMLGFEKAEKGTVYYDGQDLSTLDLREVRTQLGVVLQNSQVLPTDIFRNIVGTTSLTLEDAWRAAKAAAFDEDITAMPMGMHTYVNEGGGGFSGGQRQRLLIARAVVRKPRIIFLDEATSALDNRTQSIVTESMGKLQATRIAIAHRLSTVIGADRICVMDQGQIKEQGNYEELMRLNGIFADLARRQIA
jgi:NHLM bacteriocin system ABC transporter ATP-binding protein